MPPAPRGVHRTPRYAAADRAPLNALLWTPDAPTRSAVAPVPGFNGSIAGGMHGHRPFAEAAPPRGHAFLLPCVRAVGDFSDARFED